MNINKDYLEIGIFKGHRLPLHIFILLVVMCALLLPWDQSYAAKGDHYVVVVDSGKVRGGPAKTYPLVASVFKGHELVEIDRRTSWVNIRSTTKAIEGWVHTSLLVRKKTPPKKKPRVKPRQLSHAEALAQFNQAFSKLRGKLKDEQGKEFFGAVTSKGNGIIHINATSAWMGLPGWQKEADIKQLFSMWHSAYNRRPIAVYIDETGKPLPGAMYARDQSGKDHIAVRD